MCYLKGLVKKTEAHVIIRLLRFFFLYFCVLLLSWDSSGGGGRTPAERPPAGWGRSSSPHMADEAPSADTGQSLCKTTWPERASVYTGCFNEGVDLILREPYRVEWGLNRGRWAPRRRPSWSVRQGLRCGASLWMKCGPHPNVVLLPWKD